MGLLLAPVVYQLCLECSILRDASPAVLWSNNVDLSTAAVLSITIAWKGMVSHVLVNLRVP